MAIDILLYILFIPTSAKMMCKKQVQDVILYEDFIEDLDPSIAKFDKAMGVYLKALGDLCDAGPKLAEASAQLLQKETQNVSQIASPACDLLEKVLAIQASHFNNFQVAAEKLVLTNNVVKELKSALKSYKNYQTKQKKAKTAPELQDASNSLALAGREVVTRAGSFEQ